MERMTKTASGPVRPLLGKPGRTNAASFDYAELRVAPTLGQGIFLVVKGPSPAEGAVVKLLPALEDQQPEYRRVEILWERRAAKSGPVNERYETSMPLSGLWGTRGIELIGANGTKQFVLERA